MDLLNEKSIMEKQFIKIGIPDGWELAEPNKRGIKPDEHYLQFTRKGVPEVVKYTGLQTYILDFYIVRKIWIPPASCPKGAVFVDSPGIVSWYVRIEKYYYNASVLYADFTPPPYSPFLVK